MKMTIYNDEPHDEGNLEEEIKQELSDYFATTKQEAKDNYDFNEDEIAKYKITITVEADH